MTGPAPPALEARHITKSFGPLEALRGVSLSIRRGEISRPSSATTAPASRRS